MLASNDTPSTSMRPDVGASRAPISDSSVVLPEPDGPVSATNSPGSSVSDTLATATTGPGWTRLTSSTTTRAPAFAATYDSAADTDQERAGDPESHDHTIS